MSAAECQNAITKLVVMLTVCVRNGYGEIAVLPILKKVQKLFLSVYWGWGRISRGTYNEVEIIYLTHV